MSQRALHLRGRVLPSDEVVDLWITDGVIQGERIAGAETVSTGGFIVPGLVDAHCHIGLGPGGPVDEATTRSQAEADLAVGVMLVRDAGSPTNTRWIDDDPRLPRIMRAGRHIARPKRYIRDLAAEVQPDELVEEVRRQARAGDGWVKLVGDWIDRDKGDLAPLWPADVATEAIAAAHQEGARVTAHCFQEQSVAELVAAGIDCIEHGTGLSPEVVVEMARRGTALVPTMINLANFPTYAAQGATKFPAYSAHMLDLHARRYETIGMAREAGVHVYSGTDAGTVVAHGRTPDEIVELAKVGGAEFALGAASWRARPWLGGENLIVGASADLVVYDENPLAAIEVVHNPALRVLRGRVL